MAAIFDSPIDTFKKGWDFAQQSADDFEKRKAYYALEKIYGPTVGDADLAAKAETNSFNTQNNPLVIENNRLVNTGLGQTNAFNAADNPLKLQQQTLQNQGTQIANQSSQQTLDTNTRVQKAQQLHGVLSGTLSTIGQQIAATPDPQARGAIWDQQVAQLGPILGVDPAQLTQQLAPFKQAVMQGGADALPQIQQQIDAAITAALPPEDQQNLKLGQLKVDVAQAGLETAQAKADAIKKSGGLTPAQADKIAKAKVADAAAYADYSATVQDLTGTGGTVEQAITYLKAHPDAVGFGAAGVLGKGMKDIGGTPAYNFAQLIAPVTSNVLLGKLKDLKQASSTGASGLGQLSDREGAILATAIASIDQGQDSNTVIRALQKVASVMQRSEARMKQVYGANYGEDPTKVLGEAPVAGSPATTPGAPAAATAAPQGVDPSLWAHMTPEEQALWN